MKDLVFAINALFPIILLIGLGNYIKKINIISKDVFGSLNKLCFRILLPVSLFVSIYNSSGIEDFNFTFLLFIALSLVVLFFIGWVIVKVFFKEYFVPIMPLLAFLWQQPLGEQKRLKWLLWWL